MLRNTFFSSKRLFSNARLLFAQENSRYPLFRNHLSTTETIGNEQSDAVAGILDGNRPPKQRNVLVKSTDQLMVDMFLGQTNTKILPTVINPSEIIDPSTSIAIRNPQGSIEILDPMENLEISAATRVTKNTKIQRIRRRKMNVHKYKKRRRRYRKDTRMHMSKRRRWRQRVINEKKEIENLSVLLGQMLRKANE